MHKAAAVFHPKCQLAGCIISKEGMDEMSAVLTMEARALLNDVSFTQYFA
jgi:hypothetical protein